MAGKSGGDAGNKNPGSSTIKIVGLLSKSTDILSKSLSALFKLTKPLMGSFTKLQRLIAFKSKLLKTQESQQKRTTLSLSKSTIVLRNWGNVITSVNSQANKAIANVKNFGDSIYDVSTYGFQARDRLLSFGSLLASSIRSYSPAKANQIEVAMGRFRATVGKVLAPATKDIVNLFINLSKKLIDLSKKMDIRKLIKWAVFGLLISLIAGFALAIGMLVGSFLLVGGIILGFIKGLLMFAGSLTLGTIRLVIFAIQLVRGIATVVIWAIRAGFQLAVFAVRASIAILRFCITGLAYLATFSARAILFILNFTIRSLASLASFTVSGVTAIYQFAVRSPALIASGFSSCLQSISSFATQAKGIFVSIGTNLASMARSAMLSIGGLITSISTLKITTVLTTATQWLYNAAQAALQLILSPFTLTIMAIVAGILVLGAIIWYFWDDIVAFFEQIWQGLSDFFSGIWDTIVGWFEGAVSYVTDFLNSIWETIKGFFTGIIDNIKGYIESIWNRIKSFFTSIIDAFKSVYEGYVKPIIDKIWGTISWIWEKITGFLDWLWKKIKWLVGGSGGGGGEQAPGGSQQAPGGLDLKAFGAELTEALSKGPEGIMDFGANMLEKMGMQGLANGLRDLGKQFDDLFKEPEGGDKDVGFEASEAKESSVEELGKAARKAALGADKKPEEKTAEQTEKTATNTGEISKHLSGQDMLSGLKTLEESVEKTGESQVAQSQIDAKAVSASMKRVSESQKSEIVQLFEKIYTTINSVSENSSAIAKSVGAIEQSVQENINIMSYYVGVTEELALLAQDQLGKHDETISILQKIEENQKLILGYQERIADYSGWQYEISRNMLEMKRAESSSYRNMFSFRDMLREMTEY